LVYLNVDEVEAAVISLCNSYQAVTKPIELPNKSIEGRKIHAFVIGKNKEVKTTKSILFTGGVHAREWGGSDICINFAADLLEAYKLNKGLRYNDQYFNSEQIQKIVDSLNIIVLPDVNPDGKAYSQSDPSKRMWRGNRNLNGHSCFGVDLNRNFDFLWDYKKYFSTDADVHTSDDPCDGRQIYRGKSPFSEPETQNVKWLLDEISGIGCFIDVHCNGGTFLHSWGIDQNQSSKPEMNFANPDYDGKRGVDEDDYKEYISNEDLDYVKHVSKTFNAAVLKVNQNDYEVKQAFYLYPTSGASDDYSYGRRSNDRANIYGFTIEFGKGIDDFQPPWSEMKKIIIEVSSGMVAVCDAIA
jgi:murein tripeptide amidase MpaA